MQRSANSIYFLLTPSANWVENGTPPELVPARGANFTPATYQVSFLSGPAAGTRLLCPHPQQRGLYRERIGHRRCARSEQSGESWRMALTSPGVVIDVVVVLKPVHWPCDRPSTQLGPC